MSLLTLSVSAQNFTDSNLPIVVITTDNGVANYKVTLMK